jgi:hypothetical protein
MLSKDNGIGIGSEDENGGLGCDSDATGGIPNPGRVRKFVFMVELN